MTISAKLAADLLAAAIHWSGLPSMPVDQLPFFEPMSATEITITQCPYVLTECEGIVSLYDHENYLIVYLDTLDMNSVEDRSFIMHEMVHVLQHHAHLVPTPLTCIDVERIEKQAYRAQNAYLRSEGSYLHVGLSDKSTKCQG